MSLSLGELASRFGCELDGDRNAAVDRVATLGNAGPTALSFFSNARLKEQLSSTRAAVVVLRPDDAADCPTARLLHDDPYAAYARIAAAIHPPRELRPGIHPSAVVDPTASVAATAQIDPNAVIGERCVIGERVLIGAGTVVGPDCTIGEDCRLLANVTFARQVSLGRRGLIHPAVVIGSDGFGNAMTPDGWIKVPQLGGVPIGDDVEIGAGSTIDCGAIDDTVIENGVRIDNQCMVAHNVRIGAHTALAAKVGIAGSTVIGKRCMFAGKSGTVGHGRICDDVTILGRGTVSKDIAEAGVYGASFTVEKARDWNRRVARFRRLGALFDRVKRLEKDRK